ncbi:MAG: DNA-directed RNA polymerase subunit D [Candidatus Methanomethylophilus sp.]|jgi:DNA-directed RNA polymerase subunit D|nr:DNA-directed RNA polymerase subunit D [Methanomethylophilus sp.]
MQIEIVKMEDTRAKFILKNSSPAMANALRRTMLQDIPKMAIDKVDFHLGPIMQDDKEYESVTSLFDEIIAHRLGLIPVPTTDQFTFQKDCSCGGVGCPGCSIMYSLNKVGPATVLSGDLLPLGDSSLKVKDEYIPIVELTDTQAVLIYATAVMGTAKQHVKWQAAFGVGYSYMPIIKIDASKAADSDVQAAAAEYPGLFKVEGGKLVVDDIYCASRYGKAVQQDAALQDAVSIEWDDSNFIFKYETDGSLTAQQVLDKAVEILEAKATEFTAAVEAL